MAEPVYLLEDGTGTLVTYPPHGIMAQASAATVRVGTSAESMPDSGDAATVDSVDTTTNAQSLAGAESLSFAGDPGCTVGRRYLVDDTASGKPPLIVTVRENGTTLYLEQPLPFDVASGAAVKGIAISHALTTAETDESGNGVAEWTATLDGVSTVWSQAFRVYEERPAYTLTYDSLTRSYPMIRLLWATEDEALSDLIATAWSHRLQIDLMARGMRPERVNSWWALEPAHAAACFFHAVETNPRTDIELTERAREAYNQAFATVINSRGFWYDESDSDVPPPDDAVNSFTIGYTR